MRPASGGSTLGAASMGPSMQLRPGACLNRRAAARARPAQLKASGSSAPSACAPAADTCAALSARTKCAADRFCAPRRHSQPQWSLETVRDTKCAADRFCAPRRHSQPQWSLETVRDTKCAADRFWRAAQGARPASAVSGDGERGRSVLWRPHVRLHVGTGRWHIWFQSSPRHGSAPLLRAAAHALCCPLCLLLDNNP